MEGRGHLFFVLSLIVVVEAEDVGNMFPVGVKMCERLCLRTVGCSRFRYNSEHLSCRLLKENSTDLKTDATFNVFTAKRNREKKLQNTDKNFERRDCPSTSLIFQSNRKYMICRIRSPKYRPRLSPRLLIVKNTRGGIQQLSLRDLSVSPLGKYKGGAEDIAYLSDLNKLVFLNSNKIKIAPMDLSHIKVLKQNVIGGLCAAENRIFYYNCSSRVSCTSSGYFSMSPNSKNISRLTRTPWAPGSIAVDSIRRHLYIGGPNIIFVYSYSGYKILSFKGLRMLFIEPHSEWLYMNDERGKLVYRRSLVKNNTIHVLFRSLKTHMDKVCISNGILYRFNDKCDVWVESEMRQDLVTVFTRRRGGYNRCSCCFLP